jgi:hypothetical protein
MAMRGKIMQVQQAILEEAARLARLIVPYQVLVQWQHFFRSFRFIWERQLRNIDQLALKH